MMKAIFTFRPWSILLLTVFAIVACNRDEYFEDIDGELKLETVSVEDAKTILLEIEPLQTRSNSENDSYKKFVPDVVPDFENITQQEIKNSTELLTVVPVKNNNSKLFSRIIFLRIGNELVKKSFTLYPTKECIKNPTSFSGIILLTELDKKFHSGYRVEDGIMVSELFLKKEKEVVTKSNIFSGNLIASMEAQEPEGICEYLGEVTINGKRGGRNSFYPPDLNNNISLREPKPSWNYNKDYEESVHSGGKGESSDPAPEVDDNFKDNIHDEKLNDCLKSVLADLKSANKADLKNIIEKSMNAKVPKGYEWTLGMDKSKISNRAGATTSWQNGNVETHFDWNKLQNASDLSVARTMIHESVHAFLLHEFNSTVDASKNYPKLVEVWNKFQDRNKAHHAQMGATFINVIAKGLMAYGKSRGYNYSYQFYEDLSWGGLRYYKTSNGIVMSDIYKATVPNQSDRNRIEKTIANEYNRSTNSKGGDPCK